MSATDVVRAVTYGIVVASGIYVTVHELRRRERRATRREIQDLVGEVRRLVREVDDLRALLLEQRRYIYRVAMTMIDAGLNPPRPPDPSFDRDEYDDE